MATKLYEKDINKYVDWGGDESTNGLAVSGEKIQKFIKESLNSKFGFMYFDKDPETNINVNGKSIHVINHTSTNQYLIFSDAEDFELWAANPVEGNSYVLARFDAPAPATIEITDHSSDLNTILSSDKDNQNLSFTCIVKNKANEIVTDSFSVNISISNSISGNTVLPTFNQDGQAKSFTFNFNELSNQKLGTYLSEGTNIVKCTITSSVFNVSSTISFQYKVLNLSLTSTFGIAESEFSMYKCIPLDGNYFSIDITAEGASQKMLRVFIDGNQIDLIDSRNNRTSDLFIGTSSPSQYNVVIPFIDENTGQNYSWVTEGKHNIQMYFYIPDNAGNDIKSQTLYYDFVLTNPNTEFHSSYILFQRRFENNAFADIVNEGQDPSILPQGSTITINAEQYVGFDFDYVVLDTKGSGNTQNGKAIGIIVKIFSKGNTIEPENGEKDENGKYTGESFNVASGTSATYHRTPQDSGEKELWIINTYNENEVVRFNLNIAKSMAKVDLTTKDLVLELTALNRMNSESNHSTWKSERTIGLNTVVYEAEFDKVLWNSQNGWIDNCLVLNNGATVTVPFNIFGQRGGVTFEIDFETENVQDDDATIMKYGNEAGSCILINACNATLQSRNKTNIHTNYKDGARQKIQFIFGDNNTNQSSVQGDCPYLMYMVVNGILDRVDQFTSEDQYFASTDEYNSFTIGNTEGLVTTKIHSIRVYYRALTLNECVNNYIIDSNDVRGNYLRNDIYTDDNKTIDVSNKILSANLHIPVMTIYGNISDSIVKVFDKKANVPVDILYQDPMHPEFNYFARDAWMSNQGTSSMNYPRRNLRLYFNKASDDKSLRGNASDERYNYETRVWWGLDDNATISAIQAGTINLDDPIVVNNKEYKPLYNKKTLKKKAQLIDEATAIMFVHSGITIYKDQACENKIKNLNTYINEYKAEHQNQNAPIYVKGAYARYKAKDLFTDRWTLKCDYAESSMTHNAGIGRLWGDVMRNVIIGSGGFTYGFADDENGETDFSQSVRIETTRPGETNAQRLVRTKYDEIHKNQQMTINGQPQDWVFGDIRTSCDGYPIIIINRPRLKDEDDKNKFTEKYGNPIFLGLYNIMTDKGSTPLFGFENLKDEDGKTIFDASKCECWECLQNGSNLAQMNDIVTDESGKGGDTAPYTTLFDEKGEPIEDTGSDNKDRLIFKSYEARWPDNDDLNETCTNNLETVIRFVNFCKDAITVTVDGKDGYSLPDYSPLTDEQAAALSKLSDPSQANTIDGLKNLTNWNGKLYLSNPKENPKNKTDKFYQKEDGKIVYGEDGKPSIIDINSIESKIKDGDNKVVVYYRQTYASQVTTTSSGTMEALYNENTNSSIAAQLIYDQLSSSIPYVYILEESDDPNDITYDETEYQPNRTDDIRQWYYMDKTYDRTKVSKVINIEKLKDDVYIGQVYTYDGKRSDNKGNQLHPDAWVDVYVTKSGNNYTYKNEFGETVLYPGGQPDAIHANGQSGIVDQDASFNGKTLFEFFQDQKYEHFDVWKLACYYIYIMRFAAVDQVIKNTMMTTEDGRHYYYINYDNDTTLGVRNDGYLVYDWQVDRNTYDNSIGAYAFAGFGSVLWNLLEQDSDFMNKVQTVAKAMVSSNVLTYDIAIDMFNNKQSGTWSERLYNESEMYKYIGIYNDMDNKDTTSYNPYQNTKYLPFLQGSRASHRDWWLRHRFDLYDAKWSAGEYETAKLNIYESATGVSPSVPADICTIVTGSKFYYTVLSNGRVLGNNFVELNNNVTYTFQTTSPLAIGDPLTILGGYNIKVLDLSKQRHLLGSSLEIDWDEKKFTSKMTKLILGGDTPTNVQLGCSLGKIVNLGKLKALEELDIRTAYNIKTAEISNLQNLKKFLAEGSGITNFIPAAGVMLEEVSLPISITTLQLNKLSIDKFKFTPTPALTTVDIEDVKGEVFNGSKIVEENGETKEYIGHNLFDFILNWYISLKKEPDIKMSNYSCTLAFEKIELQQYYGDSTKEITTDIDAWIDSIPADGNIENATLKIHAITLLNAIRNDFGVDTLGKEKFNIVSGVIKIYGNGINGGLTQENYDELRNAKYINSDGSISDISLWDEKAFSDPTQSFHFDSNDSVFLTITSYNSDKQLVYNDEDNSYTVIAGQQIQITANVFPIDDERIINIVPMSVASGSLNPNAVDWRSSSQNSRYHEFTTQGRSTFTQLSNTTALLNIFEYTDTSKKEIDIQIRDSSKINPIAEAKIKIENAVKPKASDIKFKIFGTDETFDTAVQEIEKLQEYKYVLTFVEDPNKPINIDIKDVAVSFYSNEIDNDNEYGHISVEFDQENNAYVITYLPNIQANDTNPQLYVFVHLDDAKNTILTSSIRTHINTKPIEKIDLIDSNNQIVSEEDGKILIEKYIRNTNEIQNSSVSYSYQIEFTPNDYNVPIKSMRIDNSNSMGVKYQIITHNSSDNPEIIESIDIKLSVSNQSLYQMGEFDIVVTDIYDRTISKTVKVILGYFLPDGIKLVKKLTIDRTPTEYDLSNHSENTILLFKSDASIQYDLYVYSSVGINEYIWGNHGDAQIEAKYEVEDSSIKFLKDYQYPIVTYTDPLFTEIGTEIDLIQSYTGGVTINDNKKSFSFNVIDDKSSVFSASSRLHYEISFNNVKAELTKDIRVERSAAIASNFNINSSNINALGEDGNNDATDCLYFLDKNLNLYDINGFRAQKSSVNIQQHFIALVLVYADQVGENNVIRRYTSLDPWKLISDDQYGKVYMWWSKQSTWATNKDGKVFGDQEAFNRLLQDPSEWGYSNDKNHYTHYTRAWIYSKFYDYYRIVCSMVQGTNDDFNGGNFVLQPTENSSFDVQGKGIIALCDAYRNKEIEFNTDIPGKSEVTDESMIFKYINDYKNIGIPNYICAPVSRNDYVKIIIHYDAFATFLNELDPDNRYKLSEKLYNFNEYQADSTGLSNGYPFDELLDFVTYQDFKRSKIYWIFEKPDQDEYGEDVQSNIQIGYDTHGSLPDEFVYRINRGMSGRVLKLSPQFLTYCLFGIYKEDGTRS